MLNIFTKKIFWVISNDCIDFTFFDTYVFIKKYTDYSSIYECKLENLKFNKEYDDISTEVSQLRFINNIKQ